MLQKTKPVSYSKPDGAGPVDLTPHTSHLARDMVGGEHSLKNLAP